MTCTHDTHAILIRDHWPELRRIQCPHCDSTLSRIVECENCGKPSAGPDRLISGKMRFTCSTDCALALERANPMPNPVSVDFTCWAAVRQETNVKGPDPDLFLDAATIRPSLREARKRASDDDFGGRNPVRYFAQVRVVLTGETEGLRCTCPTSLVENGWPHEKGCPER